jgi:hypothetical protein
MYGCIFLSWPFVWYNFAMPFLLKSPADCRKARTHSRYTTRHCTTVLSDGGSVVTVMPREKDPRYPLYRRLGGPQSRSGYRGWRKNHFASAGDWTPVLQSVVKYYTGWSTSARSRRKDTRRNHWGSWDTFSFCKERRASLCWKLARVLPHGLIRESEDFWAIRNSTCKQS